MCEVDSYCPGPNGSGHEDSRTEIMKLDCMAEDTSMCYYDCETAPKAWDNYTNRSIDNA